MAMKPFLSFILIASCISFVSASEMRTWTSSSGATIEASFSRLYHSKAILKTPSGKELRVPLAKLSESDREYITSLNKEASSSLIKAPLKSKKQTASRTKKLEADYLTELELAVIEETNLARTDPNAYAEFVKGYRSRHIEGNIFSRPNGARLMTQEGLSAVDEAIEFLENQKPLNPMKPSKGMSLASKTHAEDIGPKGIVGHVGSNGSTFKDRIEAQGKWRGRIGENIAFGPPTARDIVMQLIIDDGVPNRGHRLNIYNKAFNTSGVHIGTHAKYGNCCVITYSGGFSD